MGNTIEIYEKIARCKFMLLDYLINEEVRNELGEPILHKSENIYIFAQPATKMHLKKSSLGFLTFSVNKKTAILKYAYVFNSYRSRGIFSAMYEKFEEYCLSHSVDKIKVVSSNMALPIYLNYGFGISKKYKTCTHLYKKL